MSEISIAEEMIKQMSFVAKIPISVVEPSGKTIYSIPSLGHDAIPERYVLMYIEKYKESGLEKNFPLMMTRRLNILIGIMVLDENRYLIVGPVSTQKLTFEEIAVGYNGHLSAEEMMVFSKLNDMSTQTDSVRFANMLAGIVFNLYNKNILPLEIIQRNYNINPSEFFQAAREEATLNTNEENNYYTFSKALDSDYSQLLIFEFEEGVISAIKNGKRHLLPELWKNPFPFTLGIQDATDFQQKSYCIAFLTLCNRAAVQAGVDTRRAYMMISNQLNLLEKLKNPTEYFSHSIKASYDYCDLVRRHSGKDNMPELCNLCEQYIDSHISEKITADDLTRLCGISKRKLYYLFDANYSMPLNEYIQRERIRKAQLYLTTTNHTMAEITSLTGFANQSYFISVFSKYCGCTPGQYVTRRLYQNS